MAQVDAVLDDLDAAMRMLRRTVKGIPAEAAGFKGAHDRLAKSVAALGLVLDDSRSVIELDDRDRDYEKQYGLPS